MSPLGQGPRGYGDWQRVDNWDGPAILDQTVAGAAAEPTTGIVECSRYGYLAGQIINSGTVLTIAYEWFLDAAGTKQVGELIRLSDFHIASGGVGSMMLRVPNLGPFCRVTIRNLPGLGAWSGIVRLFLTNRVYVSELVALHPVILHDEHVYAAAEARQVYPDTYWSGPATFKLQNASATATTVNLEAMVEPNVWVLVDQLVAGASSTTAKTVIMPAGPYRANVNTGGAGTVLVSLLPSSTGSS